VSKLKITVEALEGCVKSLQGAVIELQAELQKVKKASSISLNGPPLAIHHNRTIYDSIPVSEVLLKLFEQKRWDIARISEVPAFIEIRQLHKNALSSERLK